MTTGQGNGSHGLEPTAEINNADTNGAFAAATTGGAGAAAAATTAATDPTQGGKTLPIGGADGASADVYKPEGLDQHLIGQTDRETIDRMTARLTGLRTELAQKTPGPAIPEKPDAYEFKWSDKVKGVGGIASDDAAVREFATIAHKHKFTQEQIDAIPEFFDTLVEKGLVDKPFDSGKLLADLAPETFRGSDEDRQAKGAERLGQVENWIAQLAPAHGFDDAMKSEMRLLTMSPPGVKVLETLMKAGSNQSFSPGGGGGAQPAVTKAAVEARVADPRNDAMHPKFDEAFANQTREMFKQLYPTKP